MTDHYSTQRQDSGLARYVHGAAAGIGMYLARVRAYFAISRDITSIKADIRRAKTTAEAIQISRVTKRKKQAAAAASKAPI